MKNTTKRPARRPDGERSFCRLAAGGLGPPSTLKEAEGGGWTFEMAAQLIGVVNDHLMRFSSGSGAKTIAERVADGRVKIVKGHPYAAGPADTCGRVFSAEERVVELQSGPVRAVAAECFLDASEAETASKLKSGVIDECSLELHVLRETRAEVSIDVVPPQARRWCEMTSGGLAIVRQIEEWMWLSVGLVANSSQGVRSLLCPRVLPFADLPVSSSTPWDAEGALVRLAAYGSTPGRLRDLAGAFVLRARAGDGIPYRVPIGDVVDGELVIVREAIEEAYARLAAEDKDVALPAIRVLARYEARLTSNVTVPETVTGTDDGQDAVVAPAPPPEAATSDPESSPPTGPTGSPEPQSPTATATDLAAEAADREQRLRQLQLDALRAEVEA